MTTSSWALQLADAVVEQLGRRAHRVAIRSVRAASDDVLEVTFSTPGDTVLRGMRIDRGVLDATPGRLSGSSLEEIAFDILTTGICEPRDIDEFSIVDEAGVHWLPLADWLADIS